MHKEDVVKVYHASKEFYHEPSIPQKLRLWAKYLAHHPKKLRQLILYSLIFLVLLLIFIPIFTYFYFVQDIYSKDRIMNRNDTGVTLLDRKDRPFFTFYQPKNKTIVPISQISVDAQHAVVAIEDKDFYKHPGFSLPSIFRSIFADVKDRQFAYGGSTITQQLVKNALLNSNKNFLRKYQEIFLAAEIERVYTKDEILEMYLNSVYFGEGAFGIEEASQTYFNKSAKDLNLSQATLLAGLINAPSALSPLSNNPNDARERQRVVLNDMVAQKYISENQKIQAENFDLTYSRKKEDINTVAPHFALLVRDQLIKQFGGEDNIARSGMKVRTSLDLDYQKYAENLVKNDVALLAKNKASNGAVVAIDPQSGQVLVLVGSKDWYNEDFGKVDITTSLRQPGSSFKPIMYATALDKHLITAATILQDVPTTFGGPYDKPYKPKDYDGKFRGPVTVRRALVNSLNIPAVEVMQKVGIGPVLDQAKKMGITTLNSPDTYGLSLALGAAEVKLLELTNAYTAFADEGVLHDPTMILKITGKQGQEIYSAEIKERNVLSPETAFIISSILSDNATRAELYGSSMNISRQAAVKTGTTEDYKDALTVGYTPSIVVGVWVGNNDGTPMDSIAGSLGAGPIWKSMMEHFLAGTPIQTFKPIGGIFQEKVCKEKGLKVDDKVSTSSAYLEYFINGTEPTQLCYSAATPTPIPTYSPTEEPTDQPTQSPTATPTVSPSSTSTPTSTLVPTVSPLASPTVFSPIP